MQLCDLLCRTIYRSVEIPPRLVVPRIYWSLEGAAMVPQVPRPI